MTITDPKKIKMDIGTKIAILLFAICVIIALLPLMFLDFGNNEKH